MPTAVSEGMQEMVQVFTDFTNELLPDGAELEAGPLSGFQICENGDSGYHVLVLSPVKFNGTRCFAVIEGIASRDHFLHITDAMEGTPKMDALRISSDDWNWRATVRDIEELDGQE